MTKENGNQIDSPNRVYPFIGLLPVSLNADLASMYEVKSTKLHFVDAIPVDFYAGEALAQAKLVDPRALP